MSEYDHSEMEVDEQSEDGELLKSPSKSSPMQLSKEDALFTISDEENDTGDSLEIKPPQAIVYHKAVSARPGSSRRDKHSERDGRRDHSSHSHSSTSKVDLHRKGHRHLREHREHRQEERGREKHRHRERREAAQRDGKHDRSESSHQSRDREQRTMSESARSKDKPERMAEESRTVVYEGSRSKDKGDRMAAGEQRTVYEVSSRPKEKPEKVDRSMEDLRDQRAVYDSSRAKDKGERSENKAVDERGGSGYESARSKEAERSKVDRVLEDLRERLLDKRRGGEGRDGPAAASVAGTAAMTWDETHSVPERRGKLEARERHRERDRRGEEGPPPPTREKAAERTEREMRRERLLEAEEGMMEAGSGVDPSYRVGSPYREMVRQKEVYRRELEARRERRHMERERERTLRQIVKKRDHSRDRKRLKVSDDKNKSEQDKEVVEECQVVTVSDTSEHSDDKDEEASDEENDEEESSEEDEEDEDSETESNKEAGDTDDSPGGLTGDEKEDASPPLASVANALKRSPSPDHVSPPPPAEPKAQQQRQVAAVEGGEGGDRNGGDDLLVRDSPKCDTVGANELPPYLPAVSGCRSVEEFQCLNRIEEGTYGVVYRARDKRTEEVVALKRLKMEKEKEGFPITSLREINTLLKAQHPNIVTVREIVVGSNMDKIFIVMDYVEHDLKSLMETMKQKKQVFIPGEVKCLMQQLLRAVTHLHDNWILHRDLKTSNLLLSHKGILKVGDFGLAREYGSPLKAYTPIVVTLWYRSPELLLCTKEYSTPIDLWSVGCIFGEFLSMEALFPGKSEVDQLNRIFKDLGTPNEKVWPGYSKLPAVQKMTFTEFPAGNLRKRFGTMITESGMDLMNKFLTYDPTERVTAEDALKHGYFRELPLAIDPAMFPTWPAKSELGHRKAAASPKPPPGGMHYKQLGEADDDLTIGGFHMGAMENRRATHVGGGFSLKF